MDEEIYSESTHTRVQCYNSGRGRRPPLRGNESFQSRCKQVHYSCT